LSCRLILLDSTPPRSTLFPYTTLFRSLRRTGRLVSYLLQSSSLRNLLHPHPHHLNRSRHIGCPHHSCHVKQPHVGGKPCSPPVRSEEHTSELQSRENLVCRLLLEKKKQ